MESSSEKPVVLTPRKAARLVGFTNWRQEWRAANPDATTQERSVAWRKVKAAEIKKARRTLAALQKGGFKIVPADA